MSKQLSFDVALNSLSFGNVSIGILREVYRRGLFPSVFPIGGQVDLSAQIPDEGFNKWLGNCISNAHKTHSRQNTSFRLWHIQSSHQSYSARDSRLITFHETDQLTPDEVNVLKNQDKVYVTSSFTQEVFSQYGIQSIYLPIGFDAHNFCAISPRPKIANVTTWGLGGKFESRKSHPKVLNLWAKKYGNNRAHRLNVAVYNPFLKPEHLNSLINQSLEGKQYWNIQFLPFMPTNAEYNSFLNANDIFFALSGAEGRGLPEYHATALGSHTIGLNAHSYKDFLTNENAILVQPTSKRPAVDGIFFHPNAPFNVGNFFDFSEQYFYAACETAEKRVAQGINVAGLKLQELTYKDTVDVLLKDL